MSNIEFPLNHTNLKTNILLEQELSTIFYFSTKAMLWLTIQLNYFKNMRGYFTNAWVTSIHSCVCMGNLYIWLRALILWHTH